MKSFVAYPLDIKKKPVSESTKNNFLGKAYAYQELFEKIYKLEGSIVKCGVASQNGFARFANFGNRVALQAEKQVIAFEKRAKVLFLNYDTKETGVLQYKGKSLTIDVNNIEQKLLKKGPVEKVHFIKGSVADSIPNFLIENPDLKISFLNIDMDDYEATYTTLQYFYPRLQHFGILILDNYYKHEDDYNAANDYFRLLNVPINNNSVIEGPHYIVRR